MQNGLLVICYITNKTNIVKYENAEFNMYNKE